MSPLVACVSLLYNNLQVHALMDGTIHVECTSGIEWTHRCAIIAVELQLYCWSTRFLSGFVRTANPTAIHNDVRGGTVVNKIDRIAFLDGDTLLQKVRATHVNRWTYRRLAAVSNRASCEQNSQQTK